MEYGDFLQCVQEYAKKETGRGGVVSINHVIKNNGCELDGLVIMEEGKHISPTIYLNGFYKQYQNGRTVEDIVREILHIYNENKDNIQICPDWFQDFDRVKQTIAYKVINYSKNEKLLKKIPHKRVLDLAVVYYCLLSQSEGETATALIYNNHLEGWHVTEQQVHEIAVSNTPGLLQSQIYPLSSLIGLVLEDLKMEKELLMAAEMYVLTNNTRLNGAACIFYEDVLKKFADTLQIDLYILPSSIHEVILLPKLARYDAMNLEDMVREVNTDGVSREEVLSDKVYIYRRSDGFITMSF